MNHDLSRRDFVRISAATAGIVAVGGTTVDGKPTDTSKIPSYNADMEYRRLGKTEMMVSAVCLGGHWKRIEKAVPDVLKTKSWLSAKLENQGFKENRRKLIDRCLERGINYVDACTREEVTAYGEALRGRRDKMYFGFSWYQEEMRSKNCRTEKALLAALDKGLKAAKLDHADLWRIVLLSQSGRHTDSEMEECMKALETAKKQGKCLHTGVSSHDRVHIGKMIEKYPDLMEAVVMPYTASTKELPKDSLFGILKKHDVGFLGIKPFASNSLFKGDGTPGNEHASKDNRLARMAIRYILHNPAVTAPIPGMIFPEHVDNAADAVKERRKMDLAELQELEQAMDEVWATLPQDYEWLKDWRCV